MTARIKIVPNFEPNADGEWLEIPDAPAISTTRRWRNLAALVEPHVPEGYHVVSVERDAPKS